MNVRDFLVNSFKEYVAERKRVLEENVPEHQVAMVKRDQPTAGYLAHAARLIPELWPYGLSPTLGHAIEVDYVASVLMEHLPFGFSETEYAQALSDAA